MTYKKIGISNHIDYNMSYRTNWLSFSNYRLNYTLTIRLRKRRYIIIILILYFSENNYTRVAFTFIFGLAP